MQVRILMLHLMAVTMMDAVEVTSTTLHRPVRKTVTKVITPQLDNKRWYEYQDYSLLLLLMTNLELEVHPN